jgi:diaminopimelate decarboxylase
MKTLDHLKFEDLRNLNSAAYIYSDQMLFQRIELLKKALPQEIGIFYSLKANSNRRLLSRIQSESLGADVASLSELEAALKCGFPPERIELTGPGKDPELLRGALENQIGALVIESIEELLLLEQLASESGQKISVCVRVHPARYYSLQGREILFQSSQFGIDEEQMELFFTTLQSCPSISLRGFHIYTLSQILDGSLLMRNFEAAFESVLRCLKHYPFPIQMISLGGGFGIDYYEGQAPLDLAVLRRGFEQILSRTQSHPSLLQVKICVESGRFLAGPAGVYVAQVQFVKESRGKKIAILNGGFNQNMAVCGVGQLLRKNYKLKALCQGGAAALEVVTLAGPSCYSLDVLAQEVLLPKLQRGDFIVFENCGSYGASFSPQNFLGLPASQDIFFEDL